MEPTSIRNYRVEDFQRLLEIDRICFAPEIAYSRAELLFYLRHPDSMAKVAEIGSRIVGFAMGRMDTKEVAHVITLDVIPEARRRKVGSSLMSTIHEEFDRRGASMTFLEVGAANEGAQRFYETLGYRWVETLCGYYGDHGDAHRMMRPAGP